MELANAQFDELAKVIHHLTGLVLGKDKAYLVKHRLEPVARAFGCDSYEAFLAALKSPASPRIHDAVIEAITTKETSFFRDSWLFDAIAQTVLPDLAARLSAPGTKRHRIRIWSAAASTGQEAYSLAMLVRELVEAPNSRLALNQFSILATDISSDALDSARTGLYSPADVHRGLSESRLRRHFSRAAHNFQIAEPLRDLVQFRRLDLLRPPSDLGAFDLILCRNILIYFDQPSRQRVCDTLSSLLMDGGYFILGSAESLYGANHQLKTLKHARAILYHKQP